MEPGGEDEGVWRSEGVHVAYRLVSVGWLVVRSVGRSVDWLIGCLVVSHKIGSGCVVQGGLIRNIAVDRMVACHLFCQK
jgi:hypothetical protein